MITMLSKRRTFKILIWAHAIVAVLLLCGSVAQATGQGNKWVRLRYRFKAGQRLEYAINMTMSGDIGVSGAGAQESMPMNMKMKTNLRMDVSDVDREGTATVKMTYDEINMDMQTMGESMNMRMNASGLKVYSGGMLLYDSATETGGEDQFPMGQMFGIGGMPGGMQLTDLFGKGITAKITKLGQTTMPGMQQMLPEGFMGVGGFEQMALPEKLMRPGDKWNTDLDIGGIMAVRAQNALQEIEEYQGKRCAKIVTKTEMDLSQLPMLMGQEQLQGLDLAMGGKGQAVAYWDIDRGQLLKQDGDLTFSMAGGGLVETEPQGPGSVPSAVDMKMSFKMKSAMVLKE